jgi:hypothetical protein
MDYDVSYFAPHGLARITLRKASNELAWTMETRSGAAKRKRPHLWQAFSLSLYIYVRVYTQHMLSDHCDCDSGSRGPVLGQLWPHFLDDFPLV